MKTEAQDLKAKFVGGMVGSALGDAIGEFASVLTKEVSPT